MFFVQTSLQSLLQFHRKKPEWRKVFENCLNESIIRLEITIRCNEYKQSWICERTQLVKYGNRKKCIKCIYVYMYTDVYMHNCREKQLFESSV